MDADKRKQIKDIFNHVVDCAAPERVAALNELCGGDDALRAAVLSLLDSHDAASRFMDDPTASVHAPPPHDPSPTADQKLLDGAGTRIGPYKLLELIGEGGFGSVFLAEQREPVLRKVALKIIKPGMDSRMVAARFEAERQALALMDHPHIARVFDGGITDAAIGSRPYFVMEYVKGDQIIKFADDRKLSVTDRLNLFIQVCQAVQHAHTKGVIHRDIKPSNILVSMTDGRPFAKVIDFGIAKATGARLTDKTLFTEHRQLIGTPEYMSPEQAEGSPDIDTRTDVYGLGVLLYELLTGLTPFDGARLRSAAFAEMQRIIKEEEPPAPSLRLTRGLNTLAAVAAARQVEPMKLGTLIKGELDWIVMKSLDKDRARRYETPNALADDVKRHLGGEPVIAAPPSAAYRLRKFVRKHRGPVYAGSAVAAALVLGIIGTTAGMTWALREKGRIDKSTEHARDYVQKIMSELSDGQLTGRMEGSMMQNGKDISYIELWLNVGEAAVQNIRENKKLAHEANERSKELEAANAKLASQRDGWERLAQAYDAHIAFEQNVDNGYSREHLERMRAAVATFEELLGIGDLQTIRSMMLLALVTIDEPAADFERLSRAVQAWDAAHPQPTYLSLRLWEMLGDASADAQQFEQAAQWYRKFAAEYEMVAASREEAPKDWLVRVRGCKYGGQFDCQPADSVLCRCQHLRSVEAATVKRRAVEIWVSELEVYAGRGWLRATTLPRTLGMVIATGAGDAVAMRAIAMAKYDLGDFVGASEALTKAQTLREQEGTAIHPIELGYRAMTEFMLDRKEQAFASLESLRQLIQTDWIDSDALSLCYSGGESEFAAKMPLKELPPDKEDQWYKPRSAQINLAKECLAQVEALIDSEATVLFESLTRQHLTVNRLQQAINEMKTHDGKVLDSRVAESVQQKAALWQPDIADLYRRTWAVVRSPYATAEQFDAALEAARELAQRNLEDSDASALLGGALFCNGHFEDALAALERSAASEDTENSSVILALTSMCQDHLDRHDDARRTLQLLRETFSKTSDVQGEISDGIMLLRLPSQGGAGNVELAEDGQSFVVKMESDNSAPLIWKGCRVQVSDPDRIDGVWSTNAGDFYFITDGAQVRGWHLNDMLVAEALCVVENKAAPKLPGVVYQWASSVIALSSEYSSDWSASKALWVPDTYNYGDIPTAWTPKDGSSGIESITLGFPLSVHATGVTVRQTYHNGFVRKIEVLDENGISHPVWEGDDLSMPNTPVNCFVSIPRTVFLVKGVKIVIDAGHSNSYEEIDAVMLRGNLPDK